MKQFAPVIILSFLLKSLTANAQVITWGDTDYGGDSSSVASQLTSGLTWIDGSIVDQNSYLWTSGNPESEPYLAITADGELLDISSSDIGQFNYYGYILETSSN